VSDRTQIGPAVDADLWRKFREDVKRRKGQVRGVLGDELETAIRQYLSDNPDVEDSERLRRIENAVARMQDQMDIVPADGGTDTSNAEPHTHAPSRIQSVIDEKPAANAATEKKVAYLAHLVSEETGLDPDEPGMIPREKLSDLVKEEYGFRRDTAKRYVGELVDHFGLKDHPAGHAQLVTAPKADEIRQDQREQTRDDADDKLNDL
jgi:hypothetical protein